MCFKLDTAMNERGRAIRRRLFVVSRNVKEERRCSAGQGSSSINEGEFQRSLSVQVLSHGPWRIKGVCQVMEVVGISA